MFKSFFKKNTQLSDKDFESLNQHFSTKNIAKGTYLLREGELCKHAIFVEKGLLRAYTIDAAGKEHIIQFASENWIISDRSSMFFNEPSDLFIDAIEDTSAIFMDEHFNTKASELRPSFRVFNERLLQNHIRHLQKRINLLISATAEERYLHFINLYPDLTLRVPQWMIASYLGVTPESLSRVRKTLAQKHFKN